MNVTSDAGSVLANQPDQSAVSAPPVPPAPAVSGGIVNAAQQTASQSPPTTPAQPSQPGPSTQSDQHHSLLGRAIKHVISATEGVDYQADAQGNVKPVPAAPGSFFRRLVAGMLVAGAAGAGQKTFTGGFGAGAQAATAQAQQIDQQKYARAQQAVKDRQEQSRIDDDRTMHAAQIAHLNIQTSSLQHDLHAADDELIRKHNASVRAYEQTLQNIGGVPAKMQINGQLVDSASANDFAQAYIKNPNLAHAAPGYQRHFIDENNVGELTWDGTGWRDESGNAARPDSVIRAYDVPTSTLKSYNSMPGKTINQLAGSQVVDPDKNYSVSGEAAIALYHSGLTADAEKARTAAQRARANHAEQTNKQYAAIESRKTAALAKAEHNYWTAINSGKDSNDALSELNSEKQLAQSGYESEIKTLGGTVQHYDYSGSAAPQARSPQQPRSNQRNTPRTFSPSKWRAANPNGDVNEAIAEAKRQNLQVVQ